MQYIDTLKPLAEFFRFVEYTSPEEYKKITGMDAPVFDLNKQIKLWFDPAAKGSPRRQVIYDPVIATTANGNWIQTATGEYETEIWVTVRELAGEVNIPPRDFNYTQYPNLTKAPLPLIEGFLDNWEIVASPGIAVPVARNKKLYAEYLEEKNKTNSGVSKEFETMVLNDLRAIRAKLGI
jgi:hypothetical protein